jgi:hypothetical protein
MEKLIQFSLTNESSLTSLLKLINDIHVLFYISIFLFYFWVKKMTQIECIEEEEIFLKDFKINKDKAPHPTILLVGKRFAGKTSASVAIAEQFDIPRWSAWCGTKDTEDFWGDRFGSNATVNSTDEKGRLQLIRTIKFQEEKIQLYKKVLKEPFPKIYEIGLIFDDTTSKKKFSRGDLLEDLFSNGRHYKAVIIISCQWINQLPPSVRMNTDFLIMMNNSKRTARILFDEYIECDDLDDYKMFFELLRTVTSQKDNAGEKLFNGLVFDNISGGSSFADMFKIFRHYEGFNPDKVDLGWESWRKYNQEHFYDEELELQKKVHRKKKRMERLEMYRKRQNIRGTMLEEYQNNPNNYNNMEADYFSDSDTEEDDEKYVIDGFNNVTHMKINRKKGPCLKLQFGKTKLNRNEVFESKINNNSFQSASISIKNESNNNFENNVPPSYSNMNNNQNYYEYNPNTSHNLNTLYTSNNPNTLYNSQLPNYSRPPEMTRENYNSNLNQYQHQHQRSDYSYPRSSYQQEQQQNQYMLPYNNNNHTNNQQRSHSVMHKNKSNTNFFSSWQDQINFIQNEVFAN